MDGTVVLWVHCFKAWDSDDASGLAALCQPVRTYIKVGGALSQLFSLDSRYNGIMGRGLGKAIGVMC